MSNTLERTADLTPDEKRALLARLLKEGAGAARAQDGLAHRLFEAQAARAPDALAVAFEDRSLTYGALNARANRLAHRLRALGVGPEVRVGLCVERSPEMVVGLLAILKAGGAYIPLDPSFPGRRLALMLDDARVAVLLTERRSREGLPAISAEAPVICLDSDRGAIEDEPATNPTPRVTAANLAYIIYTSGSTGTPKGVQIPHGALANFLHSMRQILGMTGRDALLAVTTLSFDIAALELFLPLTLGARLELVGRDVAADGARLAERLGRAGATFLQATPASWRLLLEAGWAGSPGLTMLCGGEALPRELADRLLGKGACLWNLYGPTETTIWSSADRVEAEEGPVPIGRPIANTRMYVLDARLRPVPLGVTGELYIGGLGLARGYWDRSALTAERFLPDPFAPAPGARIYRTGDLARWRPDGRLECLGRIDHQVKVRGYRIEPGEIEAALLRHPAVREAVVVAREDPAGDKRLVAYVVPREGAAPPLAELRPMLRAALPEYMVPAAFVRLEAMPLTPNGKVDRQALPAPEGDRSSACVEFVAPRTPVEGVIAEIWSVVLGVPRVGVHDDFFELGGHSLLATQVLSRVRDALTVEIPLRALFEAPTVAGLAARVEAARQGGLARSAPPLEPAPRDEAPLLSFAQQSLWFLDQFSPDQATYNISGAARVRGPLDLGVLERSLAEIIRRHEVLRTTFTSVDGRPVPMIAAEVKLPLAAVDLRSLPGPVREAEAQRLAVEESRRPFDLARGPLVRAQVLRLDDEDNAVLLTMHHIITDGWSFDVAARELQALYVAFSRGAPSPLADLPIQYADFAQWQRRWLQGEALEQLVGYWTRQLAGIAPLELPTDRPRPPIRTTRGAFRAFALSAELTESLDALCRREGVTPFMLLLAAFQTLLYRYSDQDDIVVGSPIANRNRAETEGLIGYFVNMLALRTDLSGDPSFRELLGRVREVALGAYEHQDLPLEMVVEALRPPRDPSRTPLFQVMLVLQNNRAPDVGLSGLTLSPLALGEGTGTAKFDLSLALGETERGLAGGFEYNTDLFDAETIARMQRHFQVLLGGIVAHPERRLSALPITPEAERERLLALGSPSRVEFAAGVCVHRLFEAQVERTPDAIAVVSEDQALTYRQFNARANQLAHELRARGVVPGRLVAIGLPRSLDLAVGLLGILKAGGAFVPLDPAYPSERLECMLKDARTHLLLTQSQWRGRWPAHAGETICLDAIREAVGRHPAEDLDGGATSEEAAYVIYTSGSTGEPRGVVVRHRGLVNHNRAVAELFGLLPDDRVLQFSSLSFDIAVEEMFPTWLRGAAVVFRDEDYLLHPSEFSNWIQRERITALDLPTAYWHAWVGGLARLGEPLPGSLRLVVVGGEKASARSFADWRSIGGDRIRWINTYGPTEATIVATAYEPPRAGETGEPLTELPIGRPIANTQIYLLDSRLEPVPVGLPGALYIGGEGLARGYLRRPGLTAERFIPDPFGDVPGARLFRTGDLARWRTDGNLEFLGRLDQQVKVRGFRVEPGEVESALRRHPSVLEAVVEAYEATPGDKRLVAYVVPRSEAEDGVAELRRGLQATLPDYMVPATFVMLEAMPLSSSGKIDRKALPAPDLGALDRGAKYVAPRGPTEESLAQVWAEVLGLERVGVLDNFFDLGGHSLQAVQLVARITALLNRPVSVKAIFQAPTVAAMAEDLDREAAEAARVHRDGVATTTPVRSPHARRSVEIPRHLTVEERPLLSLFITGKLAPVESVALGYLPSSLLQVEGLSPEIVIHRLCGDMPTVTGFRETRLGRIAAIMIPRFDYQLYQDRRDLLEVLGDAVRIAQQLGARTVSLTGLLPSATDYGRALAEALAGEDLPGLTTGHATTTSAVVLAIRRALEDGGRSLAEERVGFVGLGSVGSATLRLMLSCLPHPAELILCDVYQKQEELRALRAEVVDELGYRGRVRLVEARADVPAPVYQASLIVGATNVPDILDIGRLAPGTILVDDSAPHLFRSDEALRRFQERGDILATEGGVLSAPEILPTTVHVPAALDLGLKAELLSLLALSEPRYITGCVLSGLLSARFDHLPPTLGLIDRRTALQHYETLDELGFEAARLHLGETALDERIVREFRARHGGRGRTAAGRSSPLVAIQPDGTRPPLFFVHPIGGNVVCYHELARQLGEDQPFYGIQAAGLEGEAEPEARLEIMAARYIEAMRGVRPDGPYCLGGWSLGGVVAFEMARQLRGQGQEVARLFLIDSHTPSPGASRGRLDDRDIQAAFLLELVRGYGEQIRLPFEVGPGTDLDKRISEFAQQGEVEPWLAAEFGPDRARRLVAVFKANLLALEAYTPGADPGRLVLLVAEETRFWRRADPTLGWDRLARGGVSAHVLRGNHHTLLRHPAVQRVAEIVREEIANGLS